MAKEPTWRLCHGLIYEFLEYLWWFADDADVNIVELAAFHKAEGIAFWP